MKLSLNATETVTIPVEEESVPIQHYLRQPQRLVGAIANPNLAEQLSKKRFLVKMRPIDFMMYHFQPAVTLKVWADNKGIVHLYSEECEIRGNKYINDRFSLFVQGQLSPVSEEGQTILKGKADLEVTVELPPPLTLTPHSILEKTGTSLLRSVLRRIKNRLKSQLVSDYHSWANSTENEQPESDLSPAKNPAS